MTPMLGKITLFPYDFAPRGWMFCDGAVLPISFNESLFQLLDFHFGGDGADTFGLPDLRSITPANCHYCICVEGDFNVQRYEGVLGETFFLPFQTVARDLVECTGESIPKSKYAVFDALVGARFGGGGGNINLPDLRSKTPNGHRSLIAVQGLVPGTGSGIRDPFVGELMLLPFDTVENMILCNGAKLPVSGNDALHHLLGNRFGGDDRQFAVPDLRAAAPPKFNYFMPKTGVFPPRG